MRLNTFIIAFLFPAIVAAQDSLSAKVTDEKGAALSFVSVMLQLQDKTIASTATNEQGSFVLPLRFERMQYRLVFSMVGYEAQTRIFTWPDTTALFPVVMKRLKTTLQGVTVTSNKPLVTRRTDRFIINVENSFLANGNSGLEVLQRSPGLWVDNNGGIRIRGSQSVMVMINDVVQRMSQDELAEYLRSLRSEDISRIEVIPNPPAEYEAAGSGGIVHIILKKARKDGLNGYAFAQYRQQGREPSGNVASSFDYKSGRFYLLGGLSLTKDMSNSYGHNENIFADQSSFNTVGTRHINNERQQYRLGAAYDLTPRSSLTVLSVMQRTDMHHGFHNDVTRKNAGGTVTGVNETDWTRQPRQLGVNAIYTLKTDSLGSNIKMVADYVKGSRAETNTLTAFYSDPSQDATQINTTPSSTALYSFQFDITRMLPGNWVFRTGAKYAGIHRDNNVIIEDLVGGVRVLNTAASNHFKYNEDLAMGYAAIERTIKQFGFKLGLRGEQTLSNGNSISANQQFRRAYFGLFPSLFLTYLLNAEKARDVFFSYSRRLQRPGFDELNPYRLQLSSVVTNVGNPDLQPQYSNNFELGYHFGKGWTTSLYYARTTGVISQVSVPQGTIFETKYYNLDQNTSYGLNLDAPLKLKSWWMLNNGFSLFHTNYTLQLNRYNSTSFSFQHSQSIQLEKILDIDLVLQYNSPYVRANSHVADVFFMDIGFSKKIIKGKARVRLYFSDIFNATRETASTSYLGTYTSFYQKRQTQNINLGMSYNFSIGKKFNNKRIEAGNSEEKSRIGN